VASQTHTHYENGVHGAASLWSGSNNGASVAVPKNQQKNLISRERDSITRKMPGWRERMLPRNMQNQEHHEGFGMEQEGFINIQLDLPEDSQVSAGGHIRQRLTSGPQSGFTAPVASQTHTHYENGVHGAASLWSGSNNGASVAVPKNQQKNLISRERDSITRKMPGWRERMLPRNMQNQEHHEGFGMEQEGFINIQLDLPEDSQVSAGGHIRQDSVVSEDMAETEDLAEADQSHDNNLIYNTREIWAREDSRDLNIDDRDQFMSPSQDSNRESYLPEGVFPVRDSDSPLTPIQNNVANIGSQVQDSGPGHQGLDRVPIRLQSTAAASGGWSGLGQAASQRIEARRLEEEETVASILDEVLASSPELANNQEANNPPSP